MAAGGSGGERGLRCRAPTVGLPNDPMRSALLQEAMDAKFAEEIAPLLLRGILRMSSPSESMGSMHALRWRECKLVLKPNELEQAACPLPRRGRRPARCSRPTPAGLELARLEARLELKNTLHSPQLLSSSAPKPLLSSD